jgi:hypothetical protein
MLKGLEALHEPIELGIFANVFTGAYVRVQRMRSRVSEPVVFVIIQVGQVCARFALALPICPYRSNLGTRVPARSGERPRPGSGGLPTMNGECGENGVDRTNDV